MKKYIEAELDILELDHDIIATSDNTLDTEKIPEENSGCDLIGC